MALRIEDYAAIGDQHTVALVGIDGSVDWLCLPRFDSPACFSNLLGDEDGSRWRIGASGEHTAHRRYLPGSNVLETTISTRDGEVRITDLMPSGDRRADLVRRVQGVRGTVTLDHVLVIRFDYGEIRPWVHREAGPGGEALVAVAGPDKLVLTGPRLPSAVDGRHEDQLEVHAGEVLDFTLTWVPSHRPTPPPIDVDARIADTLEVDRTWSRDRSRGAYADAVERSLLTLRSLTHEDTGGVVAAPTTSLPEDFGGSRNWDYRYCWLRDASLTVEAMVGSGHPESAEPWRNWLLRAIAGDPEDLQIMYAVDGSRHLPERELPHLAGYAGSRPVRIGNAAVDQRQGDVLGEVLGALSVARDAGLAETGVSWSLQRSLLRSVERTWNLADHGIWEIRGPQQHFTHSRVMMWVAVDRMVRGVEKHDLDGPVETWRALRRRIAEEVLERGYDPDRNTFTQHYGTREVDASLLLLGQVGFVAGDDPRMLGTLAAVEEDLLRDGLLMRYRTSSGVDGLPGDEHPFLACSFWLVSAYTRAGRVADARALMDRLLGLGNDVGLFSEEYDPSAARMVGNFPQAFTHLTLIQAARDLGTSDPDAPGRDLGPGSAGTGGTAV
ncbi:MAG: glycoside hydrolase family 15 protein [Marmoricola sp.]